ncbi:Succinate dehydrogenase assembly factor 3 [Aphelenchoides fujianensis]|nr:Succinate dehydrogenase assembly factor 3 [Aphelenchoides fujianensis]
MNRGTGGGRAGNLQKIVKKPKNTRQYSMFRLYGALESILLGRASMLTASRIFGVPFVDLEKALMHSRRAQNEVDILRNATRLDLFLIEWYKRILRLHYGLPPELRLMGDVYVRDEFRRHKAVPRDQALVFLKEWTDYCSQLSKQLSNRGIVRGVLGADLRPEFLDRFSDEQIRQLYELKVESDNWKSGRR